MNEQKKDASSENDWPITIERYVAYIDIMGFKNMVARISHQKIYELMMNIEKNKKFHENVKWGGRISKLVRTTTYSDSLMIYSKDESYESLHSFICTIAGLTADLFIEGIPHKGALAFGMMTLDPINSIFFGQPLIDAYLLQEELHFYGILIHATAEQKIEIIRAAKTIPFLRNYLCPLKNGSTHHLTLLPMHTTFDDNPTNIEKSEKMYKSIKRLRYKTSGHLRKYIDNTELYLNSFK